MREIKFRAWDKEYKKWLNEDSWIGNFDDMYFTDLYGVGIFILFLSVLCKI